MEEQREMTKDAPDGLIGSSRFCFPPPLLNMFSGMPVMPAYGLFLL
jgi:hypothetical protein